MELLHEGEFWVAVGFVLVIAALLWVGAHTMIAKLLDARAAAIAAELEEAQRLNAEAASLLTDYQKRAAAASSEAESILAEAKAEAIRYAAESRNALNAQIERRAQAAQDRISQAETAALNEIRALTTDAAIDGARKLIAGRLDEARASRLVESAIKDLGDKLN